MGDRVELVVNDQSVYNTTVREVDTVSFNDSLVGIAQVDGYTATEADVEISIGGKNIRLNLNQMDTYSQC